MTIKKPVSMDREMVAANASIADIDSARNSVKESMARLFPTHVYSNEDISYKGKLLVVTFHYEYSWLAAWRHRSGLFLSNLLGRSTSQVSD